MTELLPKRRQQKLRAEEITYKAVVARPTDRLSPKRAILWPDLPLAKCAREGARAADAGLKRSQFGTLQQFSAMCD